MTDDQIDDDLLEAALAEANPLALVMALVHLTGDVDLLHDRWRPDPRNLRALDAGLAPEALDELRATARPLIRAHLAGTLPPAPALDERDLVAMMSFCAGETIPDEYVPMMLGDSGIDDRYGYGIDWRIEPDPERLAGFHVLVIGAGMSGICAAVQLDRAGIEFTVVDKNPAVGGTWYENDYPGCRVDVGNHFYSYSFAPNHDWPEFYSRRDDLARYFEDCVDRFGVRDRIRLRTEVVEAVWDDADACWQVTLRTADGATETLAVQAIISGVGQLNRPKIPDIAGQERFAGPRFHSARWQHEHDLTGRRVALVGTGASAMQIAPTIAPDVGHLTIFQRGAHWAGPNPDYARTVGEGKRWLLHHLPRYYEWYRFLLFWRTADGLHASLQKDPSWPHPDRSLNATNDAQRELMTAHLRAELGDDPELLAKCLPTYPPMGKRMLIDNGWYRMLTRPNVDLVVDEITEIDEGGLVTADGTHHDADVIVYATGFDSHRFLAPMRIVGRGGEVLAERWGPDDARAHLGITMPGFPNLFCLYGPNTNLGHGGSIIFHTECQVRYALRCLREVIEGGHRSIEVTVEAHDAYNDRVDAAHEAMIWTHPGMDTWYRNAAGRVTTNSPWRLVDYWAMTENPDPADHVLA